MGAKESHCTNTANLSEIEWKTSAPAVENFYFPKSAEYKNYRFSPNGAHLNRLQNMYNGTGSSFVLENPKTLAGDFASTTSSYTPETSKISKNCCGDNKFEVSQADSELESSIASEPCSKFNPKRKLSFLKSFRSFVEEENSVNTYESSSTSSESESLISPESFLAKVRQNSEKEFNKGKPLNQEQHRFYISPSPSTSTLSSGIEIPEEFIKQTLPNFPKLPKTIKRTEQNPEKLDKEKESSMKTIPRNTSLLFERRMSDMDQRTQSSNFDEEQKLMWISPCPSPAMGFQTLQDGGAVFTAFLRVHGDQASAWKQLIKRSARILKGLQRQHNCQIKLYDTPTQLRSMTVHKLCIKGASKRTVLRCKNAMPLYITEYLITSHDSNLDFAKCVAPRRLA